jgi:hypothetical protein
MIERTVERLDETIFDKKVVAELLHDDLSATAPRLRKLFEILLTFGLFDDKYGPSRSRNAASGSIADMRLVDLRGAASKNP